MRTCSASVADRRRHAVRMDDRLRRAASDRVVLGVCGGIGEALGVDAVLVRIAVALAAAIGGIGFAAYVIAAILMPGPPPGTPVRPLPARGQQLAGLGILAGGGLTVLAASGLLLPLDVLAPTALLLVGLGLAWRQAATATARGEGPGWARPVLLDALRAVSAIVLLVG